MSIDQVDNELLQAISQTIKEKHPETTQQLVELVQKRLPHSEQEIMEAVLKLQENHKLSFSETPKPIPPSFLAYLRSEPATWYWLILATSIVAAVVAFAIPEDLYPFVYVRFILGSIFVLWLPGYTFVRALFPTALPKKTSKTDLDVIERVALSLGLSLALVPLVGLLLNYTPWGIRLTPIVFSLLALTIIFATAAIIREWQSKAKVLNQKTE